MPKQTLAEPTPGGPWEHSHVNTQEFSRKDAKPQRRKKEFQISNPKSQIEILLRLLIASPILVFLPCAFAAWRLCVNPQPEGQSSSYRSPLLSLLETVSLSGSRQNSYASSPMPFERNFRPDLSEETRGQESGAANSDRKMRDRKMIAETDAGGANSRGALGA